MTRPLKRDEYVRAPKAVIRFTRGGSHQDPPEVAIEITGHAREEWARKVAAMDDLVSSMWAAFAVLVEFPWADADASTAHEIAKDIERALALLDPPTTPVVGSADVAGPDVINP